MKDYPQNFYRIIIENMNDGVAYYQIINEKKGVAVDFKYIEVNRVFEGLTGLKREELIDTHVTRVLPGLEKVPGDWFSSMERVALTGEPVEFDGYSAILKRWYRIRVSSPQTGFIISIFNDIHPLKEAEEKLKASEQKWQFALESSRNGVWDWNILTNEVHFSPMCKRMLGYESDTEDEIPEWSKWIHPEDKEQAEIAMDRHLAGQTPYYRSEHRLLSREGDYKWILDCGQVFERTRTGQPLRVIGTHLDIHDQKRAQEALQESETLHRHLIALSPDPIAILQHGKYQMISASFTKLFGFTDDDIKKGLNFFQLVQEQERPKLLKRFQDRLAGAVLPKTFALELKTKDGKWIPCETSSAIIQFRGEPADLMIIRDITDRKQAEVERQKLEEQLLQAHKMEAIGNLSGGIAHDFNNLLTVINGHAEIATNKLHLDCPLAKDLNAITQAGRRAESLTRQLLSFSRKQQVVPKVLNINESICGLEKMMRRLIGEDIVMAISLDRQVPCIKSDPGQIEQILVNLIVNARDALLARPDNDDERTIHIETQQVYLEEQYVARHPGMIAGKHVLLKVSDNGIGMTAEVKSKIFEPFFTTKEKGKGTGIGMATVYGIIKQNKGSVYVYSEPGLGTAFNIYWPATEEERGVEDAQVMKKDESQGNETILLVEDDEAVRDFAYETLTERGYQVLRAANGKDALKLLYAQDTPIDLLFTDVVMPQMNGLELAKEVGKLFPSCKIVYSSGYTGSQIIKNGELKEGVNFVRKPYSPRDMAKKIREVLDANNPS